MFRTCSEKVWSVKNEVYPKSFGENYPNSASAVGFLADSLRTDGLFTRCLSRFCSHVLHMFCNTFCLSGSPLCSEMAWKTTLIEKTYMFWHIFRKSDLLPHLTTRSRKWLQNDPEMIPKWPPEWFDSLIRFVDSFHWFDSLIRFIDSIHWFDLVLILLFGKGKWILKSSKVAKPFVLPLQTFLSSKTLYDFRLLW